MQVMSAAMMRIIVPKPPQRLNLRTNTGVLLGLQDIGSGLYCCVDGLCGEARVQVGEDLSLARGFGSQRGEPASSPAMHTALLSPKHGESSHCSSFRAKG